MRTNDTSFTADRCVKHEGQAAVEERCVSSIPDSSISFWISTSTRIWLLGCEAFLFCLYHCVLYLKDRRAHMSSVWTPDWCNYCPGLVYPTSLPLYHHLNDWSCRGDHQCNRSLLIKDWTGNIEPNLYRMEQKDLASIKEHGLLIWNGGKPMDHSFGLFFSVCLNVNTTQLHKLYGF